MPDAAEQVVQLLTAETQELYVPIAHRPSILACILFAVYYLGPSSLVIVMHCLRHHASP